MFSFFRAFAVVILFTFVPAIALGQSAPKPNPLVPAGSWAPKKNEHPRLLGPAAYLKKLAEAKPDEFSRVEQHDTIRANGIVHAVKGIDEATIQKHIDEAMKNVARGATNEHQDSWIWMTQVALTYDLFYNSIQPADRAKMIDWLNANLDSFTTDENAFHNSTLSKIFCYLRVAYATSGENPRAKDFRDHAIVNLYEGKIVPILRQFGDGGGYTECGWYTRSSLWNLVQGLELARRMEKYDGFLQAPKFFYNRIAYEIHQPYPILSKYNSFMYAVEGDGANTYGGHWEYPRLTRMLLTQYFRGSELSKYAANWKRPGSNAESRMEDFLWEEPADEPLDMANFPLAHLAKGIGKVYARSDWSKEATWFRFECGDLFTLHQHMEVGNFEIVRHAPLATESGEYTNWNSGHAVNWLIRTVAHNCILIEMPGETFQNTRGGSRVDGNDGGQTIKWRGVADTVAEWNQRRKEFERGEIVAYENTKDYLYVAADCTPAYSPDKLKGYVRQIVFVRPHLFIIMDRVLTTPAAGNKAWLLHSMNEPTIEGQSATITDGEGKLYVQTLLPAKTTTRAVEGYTYGGNSYPAQDSVLTPLAAKWRMEVIPSAPVADEVFLHVLSTDEKPDAKLLTGRDGIGVKMSNFELRFTGPVGGTITVGGKKIPLKSGVKAGKYE